MTPPLTIVTINLNHLDGLKRTVESVQNQSEVAEWIVIDGGSEDGSAEYLLERTTCFDTLLIEPDEGIYQAFNKAIPLGKGSYLQFLNSGDEFSSPDALSRIYPYLREAKADLYYSDYLRRDDHGQPNLISQDSPLGFSCFWGNGICHQSQFLKRDLFNQIGLFSLKWPISGDWEFLARALLANATCTHVPEALITYEAGGISDQNSAVRDEEKWRMIHETLPAALVQDLDTLWKLKRSHRDLTEVEDWLTQTKQRSLLVNLPMVLKWQLVKWFAPKGNLPD